MENFNDYYSDNPPLSEQEDGNSLPEGEFIAPAADDIPQFASDEPKVKEEPVCQVVRKQRTVSRRRTVRSAVSILLVLVLLATGCGITYVLTSSRWSEQSLQDAASIDQLTERVSSLQSQLNTGAASLSATTAPSEILLNPQQVYAANFDCVVFVSCTMQRTGYGGQISQGSSTGSGFIISTDGYVVTNYHVIEGASTISVEVSSGESYDAKVIGYDSVNDVAVLKVEATDLPAATLGSSDSLRIGDMVVAIGNPLGSLTATLTVGYVSGMNRQIVTEGNSINMIQTDAAINSGNSGGPLFNMFGEVVGITSAKYSGTTSSGASIEGIGFAIPIDDVMSIIGDLQNLGYVSGAYLGVTVQDTDSASAALYGLPTGAYVVTTEAGSAADRAGIKPKDIIIGLGDITVSSVSELTRALRRFKAGDTTTVTVIRSGQRITMDITLDERPKDLNTAAPDTDSSGNMPNSGSYDDWFNYFFGDGNGFNGGSNGGSNGNSNGNNGSKSGG